MKVYRLLALGGGVRCFSIDFSVEQCHNGLSKDTLGIESAMSVVPRELPELYNDNSVFSYYGSSVLLSTDNDYPAGNDPQIEL